MRTHLRRARRALVRARHPEWLGTAGTHATPTRPLTVVVPVYGAAARVAPCLASVLAHATCDVLVIDDASPDAETQALLRAQPPRVRVLRNPVNLGYTATVNRALGETVGDVLLLNSDTVVSAGFAARMHEATYALPNVASVTALSNAAGAFSVPLPNCVNTLPPGMEVATAAALLSAVSDARRPEVPTGNGFCMLLRRDAIDQVGPLDAQLFPRGYGEENDWSMRAGAAGFRHLIEDSTYVWHARGASFGAERQALMQQGQQALERRHPRYRRVVGNWLRSEPLAELGEVLALALRVWAMVQDGLALGAVSLGNIVPLHDARLGVRAAREVLRPLLAARVGTMACPGTAHAVVQPLADALGIRLETN